GRPGRGASLSGRPFVTAGGAPRAGGRSVRRERVKPHRADPARGVRMMPQGSSFTTRPQLAGAVGLGAATHWPPSARGVGGLGKLERGGNACDAGVAGGLVLRVVEPHLNGPGGEVPVIGYDAGQREVFVLDGQGPAPQAATLEAFGALGLGLVPGGGLLAA